MKTTSRSPLSRALSLLWLDGHDIGVLLAYNLATGILALAIPLASQALVNTIAQGLLLQPVIVLASAVFVGLLLSGALRWLQMLIVEFIHERLLSRQALTLADRLPRASSGALSHVSCNRFLEVASLQKNWSKLLLDVPGALVEILVSLALLALYGQNVWGPVLIFLGLGAGLHLLLGYGAVRWGTAASHAKYAVADWLQEMVDCRSGLKLNPSRSYWLARTDDLVVSYLKARRHFFAVILRQSGLYYLSVALASAGILGLGGALVLNRELSLGQLVAAELVILNLLKAVEKLVKGTSAFYEAQVNLDKLAHLSDLPLERSDGHPLPASEQGLAVRCRGLTYGHPGGPALLNQLDLEIPAGIKMAILGPNGSGKSTLIDLLIGGLEPQLGTVEIDGQDLRSLQLDSLRRQVGLATDHNEMLEATLEENILVGREVSSGELRWALETSGLDEHLPWLPQGLRTPLLRQGRNLSRSQWQRVMVARALLGKPRLLILDEAFTGIDEPKLEHLLETIFDRSSSQTVLLISRRPEAVRRCEIISILHEGRIQESGSPRELARRPESLFCNFYPECARHAAL